MKKMMRTRSDKVFNLLFFLILIFLIILSIQLLSSGTQCKTNPLRYLYDEIKPTDPKATFACQCQLTSGNSDILYIDPDGITQIIVNYDQDPLSSSSILKTFSNLSNKTLGET